MSFAYIHWRTLVCHIISLYNKKTKRNVQQSINQKEKKKICQLVKGISKNGPHIYCFYPTCFTVLTNTHPFTHRWRSQPRRATASSGAIRMRHLAQGHHNTQLGGAGDLTSHLAVTSHPALPLELMPPSKKIIIRVG